MTGEELNNKFDAVINGFPDALGEIMIGVGSNALMKIRARILSSGRNAEGSEYPPYSTKPMLVGCKSFPRKADCDNFFKNPSIEWRNKPKAGIKKPEKGKHNKKSDYYHLALLSGGYKELREISLGADKTRFVDFSFSGRMWTNIKVISDNSEHNKGVVRIGATTDEDNAKLAGNTARKGDILKVSRDELAYLEKDAGLKLVQLFEKHGLK